jgi:hypothetical protein
MVLEEDELVDQDVRRYPDSLFPNVEFETRCANDPEAAGIVRCPIGGSIVFDPELDEVRERATDVRVGYSEVEQASAIAEPEARSYEPSVPESPQESFDSSNGAADD